MRGIDLKRVNWKDAAELVGITAIIASLVFVGVQLQQEQRIALMQIFEASESSAAGLDIAISENIEIWLKGEEGGDLTNAERAIIGRLINAMYRRARIQTTMRRTLRSTQSGSNAALIEFAIELHANPGARSIWESQINNEVTQFDHARPNDDYRRQYRDEVHEILASLDDATE